MDQVKTHRLEDKNSRTREQFRKQQVTQLVRQHRFEHMKQFQQEELAEFKKFNINLKITNYRDYLKAAHHYSSSETYSCSMLTHCHLFLDALSEEKGNSQATLLLLQILCNLSKFEEFELPGDKQTALLLNSLLQTFPEQVLELLNNLSCNPYNYTQLFTYMIEEGFIEKIRVLAARPGVATISFAVLCGIIQCRPLLPLDILARVLEFLVQIEGGDRMKMLELLGSFVNNAPMNDLAELLYRFLLPKCIEMYQQCTYECLMFLNYILMHQNLARKLPHSLIQAISQSCLKGRFKEQSINTMNLLSEAIQKSCAELFGQEFLNELLHLYWNEEFTLKSSIMKALDYVARDHNSYKLYTSPEFTEVILDRISDKTSKQLLDTLQLLASIIQNLQRSEDQTRFISPFKRTIEQLSNQPHQSAENLELCHFLLEHEQ